MPERVRNYLRVSGDLDTACFSSPSSHSRRRLAIRSRTPLLKSPKAHAFLDMKSASGKTRKRKNLKSYLRSDSRSPCFLYRSVL